jgi:hypothetical protein
VPVGIVFNEHTDEEGARLRLRRYVGAWHSPALQVPSSARGTRFRAIFAGRQKGQPSWRGSGRVLPEPDPKFPQATALKLLPRYGGPCAPVALDQGQEPGQPGNAAGPGGNVVTHHFGGALPSRLSQRSVASKQRSPMALSSLTTIPTNAANRSIELPPRLTYARANDSAKAMDAAASSEGIMDVPELTAYLTAAKTTLDLFKGIRSELPQGPKTDEAQREIEKAEQALKNSQAEFAKALGFRLCRAHFPPEIMLWNYERQADICPACGGQYPPPPETRQVNRGNPGGALARSRTRA